MCPVALLEYCNILRIKTLVENLITLQSADIWRYQIHIDLNNRRIIREDYLIRNTNQGGEE